MDAVTEMRLPLRTTPIPVVRPTTFLPLLRRRTTLLPLLHRHTTPVAPFLPTGRLNGIGALGLHGHGLAGAQFYSIK